MSDSEELAREEDADQRKQKQSMNEMSEMLFVCLNSLLI